MTLSWERIEFHTCHISLPNVVGFCKSLWPSVKHAMANDLISPEQSPVTYETNPDDLLDMLPGGTQGASQCLSRLWRHQWS